MGYYQRFRKWVFKLYNRKCFGYSLNLEGNQIINEEEAKTVPIIFNLYLKGYSIIIVKAAFKPMMVAPNERVPTTA
jgi:hypothetical protein